MPRVTAVVWSKIFFRSNCSVHALYVKVRCHYASLDEFTNKMCRLLPRQAMTIFGNICCVANIFVASVWGESVFAPTASFVKSALPFCFPWWVIQMKRVDCSSIALFKTLGNFLLLGCRFWHRENLCSLKLFHILFICYKYTTILFPLVYKKHIDLYSIDLFLLCLPIATFCHRENFCSL